jgi:hypothetical protein
MHLRLVAGECMDGRAQMEGGGQVFFSCHRPLAHELTTMTTWLWHQEIFK